MVSLFKYAAIGIPLCAALGIRLWGDKFPRAAYWLVLSSLCGVAIAASGLFVLDEKYACMFAGGKQNCLFDGAALVSLFFVCALLAFYLFGHGRAGETRPYVWYLVFVGGWAGMGLAENLLGFVIGLNIFGYALYRLLKHHDIEWGIFVPWGGRQPPRK